MYYHCDAEHGWGICEMHMVWGRCWMARASAVRGLQVNTTGHNGIFYELQDSLNHEI